MKLAKFWDRDSFEVDDVYVSARGWSDESMDAAKAKAREVAQVVANRVLNQGKKERYPYGDRPLPEEILKTFPGGKAVVTRNLYGCEILNSDEMMFVDMDRDDQGPFKVNVEQVAAKHGVSGRLYRTFAGHRLIITDRKFAPGSPESEAVLNDFGSDAMYTHLCKMQQSFRARLTPKAWRCDFCRLPDAYPYQNEEAVQSWVKQYNQRAASYATCELLSTFGAEVLPEFTDLIAYHDQVTKATSRLPLA